MLGALSQDINYGFRQLYRNPVFTAIVVTILALGIGANTALFSLVQGILLAPLPYPDAARLVLVLETNRKLKHEISISYPDFLDWRRLDRSFQHMTAVNFQGFNLTHPGTAEHLDGRGVSAGFFTTLRVKLALGREFTPEEDRNHGSPAVIISDHLWKTRFAGSRDALGKTITLNGIDYTVTGVLPPGFRVWTDNTEADVYIPLGQDNTGDLNDRSAHAGAVCLARLNDGVTVAQAQSKMDAIQHRLAELYPAADRGIGAKIVPFREAVVGRIRGILLTLLCAVALVLLIVCANVASLLLARSETRRREFAIRSALGANRGSILRQVAVESLLIALLGGTLGLAAAKWVLNLMLAIAPGSLPRIESIGLNTPVLLFALGLSLAVAILFGLAPALKSSRVDLQISLKEGGRGSTRTQHRGQSALVVTQVALTLVLLVGAGLLFRTIRKLLETDPGFKTQKIITFKVGLSPSVKRTGSKARVAYRQLIDRISQIPGVQAADLTTLVPLTEQVNFLPFWVGAKSPTSIAEAPGALASLTGPNYLRVMGVRLIRGRYLDETDTINSPKVTVIDTDLAKAFFKGQDALDQTITFGQFGTYRVVGVVGHVLHSGLGNTIPYSRYQAYASFYQIADEVMPLTDNWTTVIVRTTLDKTRIMSAIRAVVYGADSEQTVYSIQTVQEIVSQSIAPQRFPMVLLGMLGISALVLASIGVYGVISYSVAQRLSEIGIRMALGASSLGIFRMIIQQGMQLAAAGVGIGIVLAVILTRLASNFSRLLYGVESTDLLTFVVVLFTLLAVAALACYVPARRATKVDPMEILRYG